MKRLLRHGGPVPRLLAMLAPRVAGLFVLLLTSVIALHGLPCGQFVSVAQQGDTGYIASCQDGNRYQVSVTSQGRVVVQKQ